jgi:hypothetical protein
MSESSQDTAPFFGFIGAASALIFSCEAPNSCLGLLERTQLAASVLCGL